MKASQDIYHFVRLGTEELPLLIRMAFTSTPVAFIMSFLEGSVRIASSVIPLLVSLMVASSLSGNSTGMWWPLIVIGLIVGTPTLMQVASLTAKVELTEKLSLRSDAEILDLMNQIPTLNHFDDEEIRNNIQVLQDQSGVLGTCFDTLITLFILIGQPIAIAVTALTLDWRLMFILVAALPYLLMSRYVPRWHARAESEGAQPSRQLEHFTGLFADNTARADMRLERASVAFLRRIHRAAHAWRRPYVRGNLYAETFNLTCTVVFLLVSGIVLFWTYSVHLDATQTGTETQSAVAGLVTGAVSLLWFVQDAFRELPYTYTMVLDLLRTLGRIRWFRGFARTPQAHTPRSATYHDGETQRGNPNVRASKIPTMTRTRNAPLISLSHVSFSYSKDRRPALSNINLTIYPGELIALVGENGSGKTTLAQVLAGLLSPDEGTVSVGTNVLTTADAGVWQSHCSFLQQDFVRYSLPVYSNVGLGDYRHEQLRQRTTETAHMSRTSIDQRIIDAHRFEEHLIGRDDVVAAALRDARAQSVVESLPDGIKTPIGEQAGERGLSSGQWQSLGLARALAAENPHLLILDEPSSALDPFAERALFDHLATLGKTRSDKQGTTILITHRFSTARAARRILVMDHGTVIEDGTHQELIALGGKYAEMFHIQSEKYRDQ
ncbi:MAG: ABC transporter ATP-binding protein [Actinomycetaceae bacterium]|nr:ABC transporter ATP-binding protein [Actinomycetaceae bacterium]MDY6083437.1 ABC transporter ATP-binding protein [Actinomycetaceae bacterium]